MIRVVTLAIAAACLWPALASAQSASTSHSVSTTRSTTSSRPARTQPTAIVQQRDDDEEEVDKFDWLVLTSDVGFRSLRITRLEYKDDEDVPKLLPSNSFGVAPGVSLGIRLWFISLAARAEVAFFNAADRGEVDNSFRLFSMDGQLTFRAPLGRAQPYFLLAAGYSAMSALSEGTARGMNARGGIGLDWFVGEIWQVGALASVDGLLLSSRVPVRDLATPEDVDTVGDARDRARDADGAVAGISPALSLSAGIRL